MGHIHPSDIPLVLICAAIAAIAFLGIMYGLGAIFAPNRDGNDPPD